MMWFRVFLSQVLCAGLLASLPALARAEPPVRSEQLPAEPPQSLVLETGRGKAGEFSLAGRDSGQQLLVTGRFPGGDCDCTRQASYEAIPAGIVAIDPSGYVTALREGTATITARLGQAQVQVRVTVTHLEQDLPVNFTNDIVPIFTRYGCNAGGCHGKSGGQNGFALSLLGFEPQEDYQYLVRESRGRRVLLSAPAHSLLLTKATGVVAHGGGSRLPADSPSHRLLRRWLEQGMPQGRPSDPVVKNIEVLPHERSLSGTARQQLAVVAHYSDGSTRDVTRLAQYDVHERDLASVSEVGLVTPTAIPGTIAVMVRFQTAVTVFRAIRPLGQPVGNLPPPRTFIDEHVFAQLKKLGLPPSAVCDDATFLRRVTVDIAGRLPTFEETRTFLAEKAPDRREKLVERLLGSPDYADYFAAKWSAVLRNKRASVKEDTRPTAAFHGWIRESLAQNRPYDEFARALLTASGEEIKNPPVTWYREVREPTAQVEDVAQLFLGVRVGCARCHHHPLERISQQDYFGMAAFFAQVHYQSHPDDYKKIKPKKGEKLPPSKPLTHVVHKSGLAQATNPRSNQPVRPTPLGGQALTIPADQDPRAKLAEWLTQSDNPYFARVLVNRYWKHFFGRGIVDPEDDLRTTNPPSNPALLAALEKYFRDSKYDLKGLVRLICTSQVYQLSATPNQHNTSDRQNFSHFVPRRLQAEVLFDAIDQVTGAKPQFPGVPAGTRAVQLPDNAFDSYFLTLFGRPDAASACECERTSEVSLAQVLHLMNSLEVLAKVGAPPGETTRVKAGGKQPKGKQPAKGPASKIAPGDRAARLAKDVRPHSERIRELYLLAYSREPSTEELDLLGNHIQQQSNVRAAYEDILWVLINSEEFLYNR